MGREVLIVDDEQAIHDILSRFFEILEYAHDSASSAEEALTMIERKPYDMILSDYDLPGMSGGELAEIVRAKSPGTVIMLMSGRSPDRIHKAAGADVCLQKPFSLANLTEALGRIRPANNAHATGASGET